MVSKRMTFSGNTDCAMSSSPAVWGNPDYEWAIGEEGIIKLGILSYLCTVIDQYSDGSLEVEVWITGKTLTVRPHNLRLQPAKPQPRTRSYAIG